MKIKRFLLLVVVISAVSLAIVLLAQLRGISSQARWPWLVWTTVSSSLVAVAALFFFRCAQDGTLNGNVSFARFSLVEKALQYPLFALLLLGMVMAWKEGFSAKAGISNWALITFLAGSLIAHIQSLSWLRTARRNQEPEPVSSSTRKVKALHCP